VVSERERRSWRIFSNHGVVLFYVAANPNATIRTMAEALGITERQVSRILRDLADSDMIEVERHGRRNSYTINPDAYLRHPTLSHVKLRRIVNVVAPELKSNNGVERG
jgi:DNA-binding IclR family transcriptional regulator